MNQPEDQGPIAFIGKPRPAELWAARLGAIAFLVLAVGLIVLILIPAMVIGAVVVGAAVLWVWCRVALARFRGDGRRNVRVRTPE